MLVNSKLQNSLIFLVVLLEQIEDLKKQLQPKRESSKTEVDQVLTSNVGVSTSDSKSGESIAAITSRSADQTAAASFG